MQFTSFTFAIFFLIFICLYHLASSSKKNLQQILLLGANFIFYAFADFRFLPFLIYAIFASYLESFVLSKRKNKILLAISIFALFIPLLFFKYIPKDYHKNIIFPLGLSFFTFQSISYVVDVYKGKITAKSLFKTALFISFFPCITSGPIQRANNLFPQLEKIHCFDYDNATDGLKLFAWGLFKKLCIADRIALYVNFVYADIGNMSAFALLMATILYSFQIYTDFSGYSDMATGIAKYLGFDIGKNFDHPYLSSSVGEFWRKWHISLSSWLKDYVYIPLGGSRVSLPRVYFNLLATFLVSGVWHGAGWTFVVWGLIHGALQCVERGTKDFQAKVPKPIKIAITFILVSFAWIFFRASSLSDALAVLKGISHLPADAIIFFQLKNAIGLKEAIRTAFALTDDSFGGFTGMAKLMLSFVLFVCIELATLKTNGLELIKQKPLIVRWIGYYLFILAIYLFSSTGLSSNFIYNRF